MKRIDHGTHVSVYRKFTPEEKAWYQQVLAETLAEKDELIAEARAAFARVERLRHVLAALKQARVAKGMSLSDVDRLTGIGKGNLSRLENDPRANPTLETLLRLADALGLDLRVVLDDKGKDKDKGAA